MPDLRWYQREAVDAAYREIRTGAYSLSRRRSAVPLPVYPAPSGLESTISAAQPSAARDATSVVTCATRVSSPGDYSEVDSCH